MSKSVSTTRRQEKLIKDFIREFEATIDPTKIRNADALLHLQEWATTTKCAVIDNLSDEVMERYMADYEEAIRLRKVHNAVKIRPIALRW